LLHPIMPFITDTLALQLWQARARLDAAPSLVIAMWPEAGPRDEALEQRFGLVLDAVRAVRNLRQDAGVDPSETVDVSIGGDTASISWAAPHIAALTNAEVRFGAGEGSATVVRTVEVRLALRREAAAERARLEKELAEARAALDRSRELLANTSFTERAPKSVLEKERARLAEREERVRLLEDELRRQ
ncbi:MAG TPA: class I tRNA ligase family protein, partial [Candidatus Limnocylindria bacterium]|nr:class I tRNA ligase family protein [Candidatus Limnocylindria bacterium]